MPKIGCVALVHHLHGIVMIDCSKGRGHILPGGKWEEGETFSETAAREFREETGMEVENLRFVFAGMSEEGYYTYTFVGDLVSYTPQNSAEGKVHLGTWDDLKQSRFKGYYEILEQVVLG